MADPTAAEFKEAFPEFAETDDDLVTSRIAQASARVDADVWGDSADDGILYLTAHLLAISPLGQNARLKEKDGSSIYEKEFLRLQRAAASGYRVI